MTTGPQDPAAAARDRLRACHADREQVIETLKDAFVHGRLTSDELDARAGRALAARTYADLAALTAGIPPGPAAAGAARRRPLAGPPIAAGICLLIAAAAIGAGMLFDVDPGGPGPHPWVGLIVFLAVSGVWTALGIMGYAVFTSWDQRSSRGQLPSRPGPCGHAPEGERRGGAGHDLVPPGPPTDQNRAGLRVHKSRRHRQHIPARAGRAPRGVGPAPGAV